MVASLQKFGIRFFLFQSTRTKFLFFMAKWEPGNQNRQKCDKYMRTKKNVIPNFLYSTSRQMNKYYPEIFFRTACIWRLFRKYRDKSFFGITLKKWRIPLCWLSPFSPGLRGVDCANFAGVFSPAVKPGIDKTGVKKQETLFPDFLFRIFANSGGYPVVIPRKQTCSLCLKRSLCRWGGGCPALSFSVDCISHL